jgi:hypothetical protein
MDEFVIGRSPSDWIPQSGHATVQDCERERNTTIEDVLACRVHTGDGAAA